MIALLCTVMLVGGLLVIDGMRRPRGMRARVAGASVNPALAVGMGLAAASVALIVTTVPVFALLTGVAASFLPRVLARRRTMKRQAARAQAWPSVLDDVTSAVRAGLNLPEALSQAGRHAPVDLQPAFQGFAARYARSGDFGAALEHMRADVDDRVFDQLAHALVMTRDVGGTDLTQVLRSLGVFIRAELQLRGELLARQSWTVNSARMAVAAPWIVLVMLSARPSTVEAYRSSMGALVLAAVAVTSALAYAAMVRIARIEEASA
jgi:tight adherence protein B